MPIKNLDPFDGFIEKLDPQVNPYVGKLIEHVAKGDLPVGYGEGLRVCVGSWRERIGADGSSTSTTIADKCGTKTDLTGGVFDAEPLILEVGCHQGQTLVSMAQKFPQFKFLGIDITFKRIVNTGQRIAKAGVRNAFCALANAKRMSVLFLPGELDGVIIFFPDPWVKKARQSKNRLIDESFALELKTALKPGGFLWLKTDQKIYVEEARLILEKAGFNFDTSPDFPALFDQDFSSTFERRFQERDLPTYSIVGYLTQKNL
jgi:tRNA (guanine-N7-)-methyltransferase